MWWTAAVAAAVAALTFGLTNVYNNSNDNILPSTSANPAFNATLANYRLRGHNGDDAHLTHSFVQTACGANLSVHYTDPSVWGKSTGSKIKPILILTHGYPESSYIWREVTPSVSKRTPVFVADQPGYGLSTECCTSTGCVYDKRAYSASILEAVRKIYGDVHVIYAGHDRGART